MSESPIQLVAADLDGTLLDNRKQIHPDTAQAIASLAERGIRFVIASARPPRSVRHIYEQLKLDTLQINYNGALIWDAGRSQPFFHRPLAGELALEIIRFARSVDSRILITCEILDRWHTDRVDNAYTTETGRLFKPDVIAPAETYCCGPVTKLLLLGPPSAILPLEKRVVAAFGDRVSLVRTDQELLQICEKQVSKAAALRLIADHYGVPLEQTLALGDAENDIEMLSECGIGVAVANAAPRLKAVADWIAPSANSYGVLDALRKYLDV
jgi:Cof subfamily protein (haloacid dehalogenase superfamily)